MKTEMVALITLIALIGTAQASSIIYISTMAEGAAGGCTVSVDGHEYQLRPDGTLDIEVSGGTHTITLVQGNAQQPETVVVNAIKNGIHHVKFQGQATTQTGQTNSLPVLETHTSPVVVPVETPTPKVIEVGNENAANHGETKEEKVVKENNGGGKKK